MRLGAKGASEIKSHPFFDGLDWDNLGKDPSEFFIPTLETDTSSSYFTAAADVKPGTTLETAPAQPSLDIAMRKSMVASRKSTIQQQRAQKAASATELAATTSPTTAAAQLSETVAIPEFSFVNLRALQQRTQEEAVGTPKASPRSHKRHTADDLSLSLGTSATFGPEESNGVATLYIQMQLHESRTLREVLDLPERTISRATAMDIFVQIVVGLRHVHHRGIVHRDLKPTNIFLDEDNVVRFLSCTICVTCFSRHLRLELTQGPG